MNDSDALTSLSTGEEDGISTAAFRSALRVARILASLTVLLGVLVLIGWIFDIEAFKTIFPNYVSMKANTALCFILLGIALLSGHLTQSFSNGKGFAQILVGLVIGIAGLTLAEYITGQNFGLDELLFHDNQMSSGTSDPGRMAPNSACVFLFYACALLLLSRGQRGVLFAQGLALAGLFITLLSAVGYLFNASIFITVYSVTRVAIHTMLGFSMVGLGILCVRPNEGLMGVLLANNPGGLVARRLITPAVLTPILIGWLAIQGMKSNFYDAGFTCSLIVLTGIIVQGVMTARSVMELNRIEAERRRLSEDRFQADVREQSALEASRLKSEFVANVSHEIRTPMNGVLGMTNLLLGSELTLEQAEQVETIRQSGDALLTLVNEILDFSKIEAGKVSFDEKPFGLAQCVDDVINLLAPTALRGKINLISYIDPQTPSTFRGDATRLRQILINLIGNAVKFTDEGEVCLEVKAMQQEGPRYLLEFQVSDTGIGISPEALALLFRPFQQVDASATRRHGGTGLGLAISKRLAELMGGEITVSSILSVGSTFRFSLPLRSCTPAPEMETSEDPALPSNCQLLLVAPGGKYSNLLARQLETWGAKVVATSDPMAVIQMANPSFAAVLMDRTKETLPLAAQMQFDPAWTSIRRLLFDFNEPLDEENEKLFFKRITKPFKRTSLQALLLEMTGLQKAPRRTTVPLGQPQLAQKIPLRILLAEDNHINQKVGLALLTRLGYRADVAANGLEALEAVIRQPYDLVLMDIQMPEMDGVESAQAIRKKLKDKSPYLVAVTANVFSGAREEYLTKGFNEYLSKPLLPDALRNMIVQYSETQVAPQT